VFGFLDLTKIVQTADLIVILAKQANVYRQTFMDRRELPRDPNPSWQGGDASVVETIGFNDKNPVDYSVHPLFVAKNWSGREFNSLRSGGGRGPL